jgi:glucan phosphorylase
MIAHSKKWLGHDQVNWTSYPSKVTIQMNDTHLTLVVLELMRILNFDNLIVLLNS